MENLADCRSRVVTCFKANPLVVMPVDVQAKASNGALFEATHLQRGHRPVSSDDNVTDDELWLRC
jgi:hypothetical protein